MENTMLNYHFRFMQKQDIPAILNIYAPYVKNTSITFEYVVPTILEFSTRVENISAEYPYIVCVLNDTIIGYAYAHQHMERAAYQWNAELSVYIDNNYLRCGIGKKMYAILIDILHLQNIKNIYGCVTSPNENSEKLHEYLGFTKLGTYHNAGYKCGKWHDVMWFEKSIGAYTLEPSSFVPVGALDSEIIKTIFMNY